MLNFIFIEVKWKLGYLSWCKFCTRGHTSCLHAKWIICFRIYVVWTPKGGENFNYLPPMEGVGSMVQAGLLKRGMGWHFSYLVFSFIIFTFKNCITLLQNSVIHLKKTFFSATIILWKNVLSCLKLNLYVSVRRFGVLHQGKRLFYLWVWGNCLKSFKMRCDKKEGRGKQ